ncbi:hypothetical protein GVAV_001805 [Gurleya vavrai]
MNFIFCFFINIKTTKKSLDEFTLVDFVSSLVQTHHEQVLLEQPYIEKNKYSEALYVEYQKSSKILPNPLENFVCLYLQEYEKITQRNFFKVFYINEPDVYTVTFYQKLYRMAKIFKEKHHRDKKFIMVKDVFSGEIFNNINADSCSCIYITNCGVKEYDCSVFSKAQLKVLGRKLPFYKQKLFLNLRFDKNKKKIWNNFELKNFFEKNINLINFKHLKLIRYEINTNFMEKNEDKNYLIETLTYNSISSRILRETKSMEFNDEINDATYCEYSLYYSIEIFSNLLSFKDLSIDYSKKNTFKNKYVKIYLDIYKIRYTILITIDQNKFVKKDDKFIYPLIYKITQKSYSPYTSDFCANYVRKGVDFIRIYKINEDFKIIDKSKQYYPIRTTKQYRFFVQKGFYLLLDYHYPHIVSFYESLD